MAIISKFEQFTLRIREKGNKNDYLSLNDIAGFNLLDEISIYIKKNIYLFKIDEQAERTYRIEKNESTNDSLYCRIKVGKFGESSELVDTLSGSGVFHKERVHSDTIPLFFHLKADTNNDTAYLNIQRSQNRSLLPEIRTILDTVLAGLREDKFIPEIKPLKKSVSLDNFINSRKGEITSLNITTDIALDFDELEPATITIKSKGRKTFPGSLVTGILKTSKSKNYKYLRDILPQEIKNIDIIKASAEVKSAETGKIKVDLGNNISISNTYIIPSDKDRIDKSGHPTYKSLKDFSDSILKDIN